MSESVKQDEMTLGELLRRIEGSDAAYATNLRMLQREEERSPASAIHTRMTIEVLRFHPNEHSMPGIGRLEVFADREWGTGLKAESVRRMRGLICTKAVLTLEATNALTLRQAGDILFGSPPPRGQVSAPAGDRLAAYLAEVRAVEAGWLGPNGVPRGFVIGTSRWTGLEDQLTEIKARHGFTPDHPFVRSITAYLNELAEIEADPGPVLAVPTEPPTPDGLIDQARAYGTILTTFRQGNAKGRHFPRVNPTGADIRTAADLWADITSRLCPVRFMTGTRSEVRPSVCPQDVETVYGVMRRLNLPDTPAPPYHSFTPAEAEHELNRIADLLERVDRAVYDHTLLQEIPVVAPTEPPTLADLIAFHRAWEDDPKAGGAGLLRLQPMGPTDSPVPVTRVHPDRLSPTARSLQDAEVRYRIENMASQKGFCGVGEFGLRTAEAVKARLIGTRGVGTAEADAIPLADVLEFIGTITGEPDAKPADEDRWITVTKAATVAGVKPYAISRAAAEEHLRTNGKKGNERRIDKISLCDWMLARAEKPEAVETDAQVEASLRRAERR
jgi:hypothetical protein